MPPNSYPVYYIQLLKELEKNEYTKRELRDRLNLTNSKLYRAIYKLQTDGLIIRENRNGKEILKITEKGRGYLQQLRQILTT